MGEFEQGRNTSELRQRFEQAFPKKAHWIEFDEKQNKYYCPYVADAQANEYQAKWEVWQNQQSKIEQLEKEKVELHNKIKSQIELLEGASKSIAYNEREKNIMKSQADDLERLLRGECE